MKKGLIILAIVASLVLAVVFLFKTKPSQPPVEAKQRVWPIEAMQVDVAKLAPIQSLYGKVESNELVKAASPVNGMVAHVWVKDGEEVKQGQKLVALSDADVLLPYQIAKADVADTEAQLKLQELTYQANKERLEHEQRVLKIKQKDVSRNQELIKKQLASQSTLDKTKEALVRQEYVVVGSKLSVEEHKVKLAQLKARLAKAKANLKQAEINRERGVVVAPYDGRIAKVSVSVGDRVGVNSPLVSYYSIASLELRAKIPVSQLRSVYEAIQSGDALFADFDNHGEVIKLPLNRLAGESSTSGVDAFFDLPETLKITRPGDLLQVNLHGKAQEDVFAVPYSALYGADRVYVIDESNSELRALTVQKVGEIMVQGNSWVLLKDISESPISSGAWVGVTHLPNAISGLKVKKVTPNE